MNNDRRPTHLPSDKYFEQVKTQEDLAKFIGSGMAWEVEPNCPSYWNKHLQLKQEWEEYYETLGTNPSCLEN